MGVDASSFPRVVRDAAMSVIKKMTLAWGGGVKEKKEESKAETTVAPLPFAGEGKPDVAGGRAELGYDEIPVEGLMDGIVRLARDGLGAAVKTGATAGSFVASGLESELKGFAAETAAEFKVLRRYIGRLVCGR